jgi:pyruvate-formate lyase
MVNTTQLQENIFKQIDWSRYNFSKSEWDDYGASGCLSVNDMDNITDELKQLPVNEVAKVLSYVLDNYSKKKYAEMTVNSMLLSLDDMDDFETLLDSDYRFEY